MHITSNLYPKFSDPIESSYAKEREQQLNKREKRKCVRRGEQRTGCDGIDSSTCIDNHCNQTKFAINKLQDDTDLTRLEITKLRRKETMRRKRSRIRLTPTTETRSDIKMDSDENY